MATKHYNANYLEGTAQFLKELKEYSYNPFIGLRSGTVIDLGCGTGIDVSNLANLLGDKVEVTGIDHDDVMLSKGREAYADQTNVKFILTEANTIPFDNNTIDGLRAERLLQHLTSPESTISEIYRVLKTGRPLVIVETDWSSLTFYNEFLPIENNIIRYLTDKKINNGVAAKKLTVYMRDANFKDIHLEIFPFLIKSLKEANDYLWIERMIEEATYENFITKQEQETFVNALKEADVNNYFACSINVVIVSSVK